MRMLVERNAHWFKVILHVVNVSCDHHFEQLIMHLLD